MKSKLLKSFLLGSIILAGANMLASCNDSKNSTHPSISASSVQTSNIDDEDPHVVKLEILTMPAKTVYLEGEVFNPAGIVLKATWSHGIDEEIRYNEITYDKTPVTADTKSVKVTYEGVSVEVPITISSLAVESLAITKALSTLNYPAGDKFTLNGLEVTATFEDKTTKVITTYDVKIDDKDVTAEITKDGVLLEKGTHTVTIIYKGKEVSFNIEIYNGYRIEAENVKYAEEVTENDKNYIVRVNYNPNSANPQMGPMLYKNDKADAVNASGQGYMGEIKGGNSFDIHFWSDVERKADIVMTAASGVITKDSDAGTWKPLETADIQLNQLMRATANGKEVTIADDVILPGFITEPNADGTYTYNPLAWANFIDVAFGEMDLLKGDNVIRIEIISEIAFTGGKTSGKGTVNIDKFEVNFKD